MCVCQLAMCISEGMALCPWGELEDLKSKPHVGRQKNLVEGENSAFLKVGKELGTLDVTAVALAYALLKFPSSMYFCTSEHGYWSILFERPDFCSYLISFPHHRGGPF